MIACNVAIQIILAVEERGRAASITLIINMPIIAAKKRKKRRSEIMKKPVFGDKFSITNRYASVAVTPAEVIAIALIRRSEILKSNR